MSEPLQGNGAPQAPQGTAAPEAGNGGNAGATQSTEQQAPQPKFMTADEFNRAFSARQSAFEKKVETQFATILEKLAPKPEAQAATPEPEPAPAAQGKTVKQPDPELIAMKRELEAFKKAAAEAEAQRKNEREKRRSTELRAAATAALVGNGIPEQYARKALYELIDGKKLIEYESPDSDALVFKDEYEAVPLLEGVKRWIASEDAKLYRPPSGANGSGERPANAQRAAPQAEPTPRERIAAALAGRR